MNRLAASVLPVVVLSAWSVYAQTPAPAPAPAPHMIQAANSNNPGSATLPLQDSRASLELRADIFMARKMYPEAIRVYGKILALAPNDPAVLNKIGVAYQQESDPGEAAHYYKRALKADKNFASAINNLGTVEYSKRHYGRAIRLYKQAMTLHPQEMGTVYSNLGYAYFADKQFNEALNSFEKALAVDPDVFSRRGGLGSTIQQRSATDPGMFNFLVAKTYALQGDAERCAHFLRIARDEGYKSMSAVQTDPAFAKVIKDQKVLDVLQNTPTYTGESPKPQAPTQP